MHSDGFSNVAVIGGCLRDDGWTRGTLHKLSPIIAGRAGLIETLLIRYPRLIFACRAVYTRRRNQNSLTIRANKKKTIIVIGITSFCTKTINCYH